MDFLSSNPNKWDIKLTYKTEMGTGVSNAKLSVKRNVLKGPVEKWYVLIDTLVLVMATFSLYLHLRSLVRLAFYHKQLKNKW